MYSYDSIMVIVSCHERYGCFQMCSWFYK